MRHPQPARYMGLITSAGTDCRHSWSIPWQLCKHKNLGCLFVVLVESSVGDTPTNLFFTVMDILADLGLSLLCLLLLLPSGTYGQSGCTTFGRFPVSRSFLFSPSNIIATNLRTLIFHILWLPHRPRHLLRLPRRVMPFDRLYRDADARSCSRRSVANRTTGDYFAISDYYHSCFSDCCICRITILGIHF